MGEEQLKPEEQPPVVTGEVVAGAGSTAGPRRLLRSRQNRIVGGVCGGVAEYLNQDPVLVRVLWVFLTLITMIVPGVLLYLLAMIIVPENLSGEPDAGTRPRRDNRALWGGILIVAGLYWLTQAIWARVLPAEWLVGWDRFWDSARAIVFPVVLIGAGLILVFGLSRRAGTGQARLTRSRQSRLLAGVCGGIGRYFHVDPIWVRLLWVLLFWASWWVALIAYVLAMLLIPEE